MGENSLIRTRKVVVAIDRNIDRVLTVLFLIILAIGMYFIYDSWYVFNRSSLDRIPGYVWNGPETLADLPEEAIAWITIDDTKIDCPIMHGKTNEEYLNKNPYGEYSLAGSIFLDSRNKKDFSDEYSVLYGHHMSGGYMFGSLDQFLKAEYLDEHRTGTLTLRDSVLSTNTEIRGKAIKVNIFAVVETDASNGIVFGVPSEGDILSYIKENAVVYREPEVSDGRILALTTCKSPLTTERFAVFATLQD